MTVRELIVELEKQPADNRVLCIESGNYNCYPDSNFESRQVSQGNKGKTILFFAGCCLTTKREGALASS